MLANNDKHIYRFNMTSNQLADFTTMPPVNDFKDCNGLEFASFTVFDNQLAICGGQVQPNIMTNQVNFLNFNGSLTKKTTLARPICMHGAVTVMHRRIEPQTQRLIGSVVPVVCGTTKMADALLHQRVAMGIKREFAHANQAQDNPNRLQMDDESEEETTASQSLVREHSQSDNEDEEFESENEMDYPVDYTDDDV